ncbi:ZF316 protein, partial [Pheucticus melanocephalus]|nr:ZF316 protein [Pheucticus melanocephalus]
APTAPPTTQDPPQPQPSTDPNPAPALKTPKPTGTCSECGKNPTKPRRCSERCRLHAEAEKPHRCADCGKGFIRGSDLERHRRVHT